MGLTAKEFMDRMDNESALDWNKPVVGRDPIMQRLHNRISALERTNNRNASDLTELKACFSDLQSRLTSLEARLDRYFGSEAHSAREEVI